MGNRAVLTITEAHTVARFYALRASPTYQVRHLADWLHHQDSTGQPVSIDSYRHWVAARPGFLPDQDITARSWHTAPDTAGDLDHRYHLDLDPGSRAVRYTIAERNNDLGPGFTVTDVYPDRPLLYQAAIEVCQRAAACPTVYPHMPAPDWWAGQADTYRHAQHGADPVGWPADPPLDPAVRRRMTATVVAAIDRHYPSTQVSVTIADTPDTDTVDGADTVTVVGPGWWAGEHGIALTLALAVSGPLGRAHQATIGRPAGNRAQVLLRPCNLLLGGHRVLPAG